MSLCESFAAVENRDAFDKVVQSVILPKLDCECFSIFLYQESKEGFISFYNSDSNVFLKFKDEIIKNAFLKEVLNSPEPLLIPKGKIQKTSLQAVVAEGYKKAVKKILFYSIPSKRFQAVLCIGYSRNGKPQREDLRLVRQLCSQLNITLTNIFLMEKRVPLHSQNNQICQDEKISVATHNIGIIGSSQLIQQLRRLISIASESDTGVLILGESGTGKELVAKGIHEKSNRKNKKMVKVNCAAIPENLLESELFGHEKGSFTGAISQKKGKFEIAHGGTLFLDEIGELPLTLQAKLLRAIQEKQIERIGGSRTLAVNVRIVTATSRDLLKEISKGNFRADLYYRLNIFPITVPSLKERIEDVKDLAEFFTRFFCIKNNQKVKTISAKALRSLEMHSWPGNVRELEHAIERAVLLSNDKRIEEITVLSYKDEVPTADYNTVIKSWREFEKDYLLRVLKFCKGRISGDDGAAALLQLPSTTLNSRLERLGIKKRHYLS
nr:sigma-54 dependent transcriptional regulator [uncultured Flavobacterium sp.]